MACSDKGDDAGAIPFYLKALELEPNRPDTLYNLGLIYKYRGEWELSLDYNRRAYALAPQDEAARWNLAIAATALRRWDLARNAWKDQGILEGEGAGPIEMNLGNTPVRLNPAKGAEVVWTNRIDPVRARILNIPFPESGYRHGDVVLHDGAPVGYRELHGGQRPVFNVLELFESGGWGTWTLRMELAHKQDMERLAEIANELSAVAEDWTGNIEILCKACSEGTPHEHDHAPKPEPPWKHERVIGLAAKSEAEFQAVLGAWNREGWESPEWSVDLPPA